MEFRNAIKNAKVIIIEQLIQDSRLADFYNRSEKLGGVFPPEDISRVAEADHEVDMFEEFGL